MSGDATKRQRLIAAYGGVATRLAFAMTGDQTLADQIVREAADAVRFVAPGASGERGDDEWIALLAEVRERAIHSGRSRANPPLPRHPGDTPLSTLPIDGGTLFEALTALPQASQTVLWRTLLGVADDAPPEHDAPPEQRAEAVPEALAEALEELRAEMDRRRLPGDEDIP